MFMIVTMTSCDTMAVNGVNTDKVDVAVESHIYRLFPEQLAVSL